MKHSLITHAICVMLSLTFLLLSGCTKETAKTESSPNDTSASEPPVIQAPPAQEVILENRVDAEYERWLASAMVLALSMEYPDFELTGIYAASATALDQRADSSGAYIFFRSGGTDMAVESLPLAAERTETGTRDISAMALGFASFDEVSPADVPLDTMTELTMEALEETLSQSLLVSLYYH